MTPSGEAWTVIVRRRSKRWMTDSSHSTSMSLVTVASGTGANRIRVRLEDLPDVAWVGMFNAARGTPTLEELLAYDAALLVVNTPLDDPVAMGHAMRHAVRAGRLAYLAGRMEAREIAIPSSPTSGMLD